MKNSLIDTNWQPWCQPVKEKSFATSCSPNSSYHCSYKGFCVKTMSPSLIVYFRTVEPGASATNKTDRPASDNNLLYGQKLAAANEDRNRVNVERNTSDSGRVR